MCNFMQITSWANLMPNWAIYTCLHADNILKKNYAFPIIPASLSKLYFCQQFWKFQKATREKQFWDSSTFRNWNKRVPTCPHLQVYIVLIIRQVDKQKGKLKLCQACPRASAFQNRLSTPAGSSYTLLFFLFINLSEMSIEKMTSWNYFEI